MKVIGEAAARGSVETVWRALHDAGVLARAIPGCERFEVSGPGLGQFIATTTLPAISGTYAAKLTVVDQQMPSLLRLKASATGDQGGITADVTLRLNGTADSTTLLSFEASGTVTGTLAGVGTRLLASAAKRIAAEFFAVIDENVAADASRQAAAAPLPARAEPPGTLARPAPGAGSRTALVAGAAIGLAGVIIGVLAGRRGRRADRVGE